MTTLRNIVGSVPDVHASIGARGDLWRAVSVVIPAYEQAAFAIDGVFQAAPDAKPVSPRIGAVKTAVLVALNAAQAGFRAHVEQAVADFVQHSQIAATEMLHSEGRISVCH